MVNMDVYYICPHRAITTKQGIITGPLMEKQGHYENENKNGRDAFEKLSPGKYLFCLRLTIGLNAFFPEFIDI